MGQLGNSGPIASTRASIDLTAAEAFARSLGRTEDLAFSPGGDRLAFVAYSDEAIGLLDVADTGHGRSADEPAGVVLPTLTVRRPHGIAFVDDDVVVVANRMGGLSFFRLAESEGEAALQHLEVGGVGLEHLDRTGSVATAPLDDGSVEIVACQNRGDTVTGHRVEIVGARVHVSENRVIVGEGLDIPDGVALHGDVLAVSNHFRHVVSVHDRRSSDTRSTPQAILLGCLFPHGLAFDPEGTRLYAADAGGGFVQVYERPGDAWTGVCRPARSIRVVSDEAVAAAGYDEGGPKGVDVSADGRWLAVTGENVPLALIDLHEVADAGPGEPYDAAADLRYEQGRLDAAEHRAASLRLAERRASRRPRRLLERTWGRARYELDRRATRLRRREPLR